MSTANYLVGAVVNVTAGGANLYVKSGNIDGEVGTSNVTNAQSGGYQELKPTIKKRSGSATCVYNGDDLPTLEEGMEISVVYVAAGGKTKTTNALITKITDQFDTGGDYTWQFTFESTTAYS